MKRGKNQSRGAGHVVCPDCKKVVYFLVNGELPEHDPLTGEWTVSKVLCTGPDTVGKNAGDKFSFGLEMILPLAEIS